MPASPPFDNHRHQVLRGLGSDIFILWRSELEDAADATGCSEILFPDTTPPSYADDEEYFARHTKGTWQNLAWNLQCETATRLLAAFISGPMWAYLLTRWPNDECPLLGEPDEAVKLAEEAYVRFRSAPATERERSRMLYELENGKPEEYPSDKHFQDAKEWLETAVHSSTTAQAVAGRRRLRDAASPVSVKREVAQGPSLAEIPNSSARRRRRPDAEDTPEGPERRRVKLEP
ncbi:hypothetical protein VMCG_07191 [Cytospora schulzeri]|uniref:Uncharacterized protein n=1 Tax=Cytospora schulzeri TaxID=448051 RepID=A0A423W4Y4_9PEZI|nr:hypothetical protein VMCG_07191 [Valsa malicola]